MISVFAVFYDQLFNKNWFNIQMSFYIFQVFTFKTNLVKRQNISYEVMTLTNFLWQHLEVGHSTVFEKLDAVDAVKAIVFDHVEGTVNG